MAGALPTRKLNTIPVAEVSRSHESAPVKRSRTHLRGPVPMAPLVPKQTKSSKPVMQKGFSDLHGGSGAWELEYSSLVTEMQWQGGSMT